MQPLFPGVDPYLESSGYWPGFHDALVTYMRESLQPLLLPGYYAEMRTRDELGVSEFDAERVWQSDVPLMEADSRLKVNYLEIRDHARGDQLITLVEILSPSNEQPGPDREAFERKQEEVLASDTHWIEVDLLRQGTRLACHPSVDAHCRKVGDRYTVVVSHSQRRRPRFEVEVYGFRLCDPLPLIGVPLRDPDFHVPLDLGLVFRRAYETGPYSRILPYDRPPEAPLDRDEVEWVRSVLEAAGVTWKPPA